MCWLGNLNTLTQFDSEDLFFLCLFVLQDPEALAQLMKNMPLTNDGKFLLLEPETGDMTNGAGQEDLESEA